MSLLTNGDYSPGEVETRNAKFEDGQLGSCENGLHKIKQMRRGYDKWCIDTYGGSGVHRESAIQGGVKVGKETEVGDLGRNYTSDGNNTIVELYMTLSIDS